MKCDQKRAPPGFRYEVGIDEAIPEDWEEIKMIDDLPKHAVYDFDNHEEHEFDETYVSKPDLDAIQKEKTRLSDKGAWSELEEYEDELRELSGKEKKHFAMLNHRRRASGKADELESLSRFGQQFDEDNEYDPEPFNEDQLSRAVYDEMGRVIPRDKVTPRDEYLYLMRKFKNASMTDGRPSMEQMLMQERAMEAKHKEIDAKFLESSTYKRMIAQQEKLEMATQVMEDAEDDFNETIEKYKVNTKLEKMRAIRKQQASEDKASTDYLVKKMDTMEREGVFSQSPIRSPTTGKEVTGNKKHPKCLLCYDYGWRVEPLKKIATTIKQAKHLGLYSYKGGAFNIYDPNVVPPTAAETADYTKWHSGDFEDADWIGDNETEEIEDNSKNNRMDDDEDGAASNAKQKEAIMLDIGVSENEADAILSGRFMKLAGKNKE
eukprot:gene17383-20739_t